MHLKRVKKYRKSFYVWRKYVKILYKLMSVLTDDDTDYSDKCRA